MVKGGRWFGWGAGQVSQFSQCPKPAYVYPGAFHEPQGF